LKILITGSKGMLAKTVIEKLEAGNELICVDIAELDITDQEAVTKLVKEIAPDYIINCAAYTAVDKAEEEKEMAEKVNVLGPLNLAVAARETDTVLIHISTDYVFSGEKEITSEYLEEEPTAPVTVYGGTKERGEKAIWENWEKHYILRTAWLYGDGNNFVRTMLKLGKEKDELKVVNDQHGSPTYTEDLADIIKQIIDKKISYGIYHTTNLGFTTWYDFTKKIFEIAKIDCKLNPCTTEEFPRPAKRPKNSKLSKSKISAAGIKIPNYGDALQRYLNKEGE